ncbi:hypothetical protein ACQ4PT_009214 [Festuca glaucescens]
MALQLRRLLPHGYAHRAVTLATKPSLPPAPAMLHFGTSQRYSRAFTPYSPLRPCQTCGVTVRSSSARQMSSGTGSWLALQLKSSTFLTTKLSGYHGFVSSRAADIRGVALNASGICTSSRLFSTAYGRRLRFLVRNKRSFSSPNVIRRDGSVGHSLFRESERRHSTLAACSTVADEASTSTSKSRESGADTMKGTVRRKKSAGSKKEVSAEMEEKKVPTKKKTGPAKIGKTAAKATEEASVNQEEKKAAASKSKKGVGTSKEKKTVTKPKRSSKAKESAAAIAAADAKNRTKTSADGSGSGTKPLIPLYPPTAKSVVVVESATKAKVIQKYLGDMYEVLPSYGHVRDLAGRSRSVRPDDDFSMVWEVPTAAWTHLKSIKVALKGAENLILASDPDREGEAISWHIKEMLAQQGVLDGRVTVARVVFHEITENAIKNALMSPRHIDMDLVNAYLARRSLDYLIGFGISPLLWRKLPGCQSAGRVQSAALALVCDQEAEVEQFSPQEYWTVDTDFKTQCSDSSKGLCLTSRIKHLNSKKLDQLSISSREEAQAIEKRIYSCQFEIQVDIGNPEGDMTFHSSASRLDFKGYQAVYEDTEASGSSENPEGEVAHQDNFEALSKLEVKDLVSPVNVHLGQHFTKPPFRYSEGALIKKMEELGIGRPSTYASIMRVLQDRKYVTIKSRVLHPEFRGRMVSAFLSHLFSEIADYSFTANMETELDNVSAGSTEWKGLLKDYWERFNKYCGDASQWDVRKVERMLEEKFSSILFPDLASDSRICPSCSEGTLRFKVSRYGEGYFIGCDRHPKCKYIARTLSDEDDDNEASEETPRSFEPRLLGLIPDTSEQVFLKQGPYGYYIQVGEDRKGASQKRAPLSEVKDVDSVTIEDAIELLQYPKNLGNHPDDEHPVLMTHSKAGFSVRHRRTLAPVPKSEDPKKMTLKRALKLLTGKNVKKFGRPKGKSNKDAEVIEWH